MKKSFYLFIAIFLSACLPAGVQVPQSPLLSVLERKAGLIAFIGLDGNVYITDQGATDTSQLTKDATPPDRNSGAITAYQIPTWSLDSSRLAFIRLGQNDSEISSALFVADIDAGTVKSVYSSESEHPFYLSWSPDDSNLSFLSSTAMGQTMMLQSIPAEGGERSVIDTGTPFYWSWAPDGKTLIIHRGAVDSTLEHRLSFLKMEPAISEFVMDEIPASFQAPAWSPDGEYILLTQVRDNANEIILTDSTGATLETIATFDLNTAFAWSFDSKQFAYISGAQPLDAGTIGDLHVGEISSSDELIVKKNVVGFFWSPNGKKLAYFVPYLVEPNSEGNDSNSSLLLFQLNVLDIASGESKESFTFRPTEQFLSIIPYFDQYHQSTTIWSPDSNNLLLSFLDQDGNPGIAVVAASGQLEPRIIADGYFAVWSWE